MTCLQCTASFAVYGLAIYCPACGQLAPAQQFTELVRVQRERIALFDSLDEDVQRDLRESGVVTATYEGAIKDGFPTREALDRVLAFLSERLKPPTRS